MGPKNFFILGCLMITMNRTLSSQNCPFGWIYVRGKCWLFEDSALNWSEARLRCAEMGADLASIVDDQDSRLMFRLIENFTSIDVRSKARRSRLAQQSRLSCFMKKPMSLLVGYAEVVLNTPTVEACLQECLNGQTSYGIQCGSVMYYNDSKDCILNTQTRLTKPDLYTTDTSGVLVDYYDNNCGDQTGNTKVCYNTTDKMALFGFADQVIGNVDIDKCKEECTMAQTKYKFNCKSGVYFPGERTCVISKESRTTKPTLFGPEPTASYFERSFNCGGTSNQTGPCNRTNMDLVFVVDSSGSIGAQSFENVRLFLKSMVNSFNIDPNGVNVALVQFNENPRTEFHLKSYQTNAEVIAAIDAMQWMGGYTQIGKALKFVQEQELVPIQGDRTPMPNVVIVITDGMSQDNPASPAQRLRSSGVITYAVGVTEAVSDSQLMTIAGSAERVYKVADFNRLDDRLRDQILKDVCNPPPTPVVTPAPCYPSATVSCLPASGYPVPPQPFTGYGYQPGYQVTQSYQPSPPAFSQGYQPFTPGPPGNGYQPNPPSNNYQPNQGFHADTGKQLPGVNLQLTTQRPSIQLPSPAIIITTPVTQPIPVATTELQLIEPKDFPLYFSDAFQQAANPTSMIGVWIGLTDQFYEGRFIWMDKTISNYSNWKFNEPDGDTSVNCVVALIEPLQRWMDIPCSSRNPFVCKMNPKTIQK